jgi:hypothetical protein
MAVSVKGYVLIPKRLVTVCGAGYFHGDDPFNKLQDERSGRSTVRAVSKDPSITPLCDC